MTLTPGQSRLVALGLLVVVVTLVVTAVLFPIAAAFASRISTVQEQQFQIARLGKLAGQHDALEQQLRQARQRNPSRAFYVAGATPALAAANLQRYIRQLVDKHNGDLTSTQIITGSSVPENGTGLNIQLKCSMQDCFPILHGLESGKPMLFIHKLEINARPIPARRPDQISTVELSLRFMAVGYLLEQGG